MCNVTEWQCNSINVISVRLCVMYFLVSKFSFIPTWCPNHHSLPIFIILTMSVGARGGVIFKELRFRFFGFTHQNPVRNSLLPHA